VRARLLESHQGIRGGYGLGRGAATVSVADIIQAIDGPLTVTACSAEDHSCDQYAKCNIRDPLWRIKDRIVSALAATSLAELAADVPKEPSPTAALPLVVRR
jgi:Rrf2 family protein